MTGATFFLLVAGVMGLMVAVDIAARHWFGPDNDLDGEWQPDDRPWWKP